MYLYTLSKNYKYKHKLLQGIVFKNEWLDIAPCGTLTITKGYSWDGCSPKFALLGFTIGTPDGHLRGDGYPVLAWASLVHDVLCQFKDEVPITKRISLAIFDDMLKEVNWKFRKLYVVAVNLFGPQKFKLDK